MPRRARVGGSGVGVWGGGFWGGEGSLLARLTLPLLIGSLARITCAQTSAEGLIEEMR